MYFVLKRKLYKVELRLLFNITLMLFTMCSANSPLKREHISNSESLRYHSNSLSLWNIYIMSNVFTMQQPCSKLYFLLTPCVARPLRPVQRSSAKRSPAAELPPRTSEKPHAMWIYPHLHNLRLLLLQRHYGPKVWFAPCAASICPASSLYTIPLPSMGY